MRTFLYTKLNGGSSEHLEEAHSVKLVMQWSEMKRDQNLLVYACEDEPTLILFGSEPVQNQNLEDMHACEDRLCLILFGPE